MNILEIKYINNKISNIELEYIKKRIPLKYDSCMSYKSKEARDSSLIAGIMIYNNLNVSEDKIKYNKLKKPYVENASYFNISHSKEFIVFTKSIEPIGIDIEHINDKNMNILNYAYSESEQNYILNGTDNLSKVERLTKLWTIKESLFKASGVEKYIEPKSIKAKNDLVIDFCGDTYNIYSFRFYDYYITVASIKKYDDITLIEDTIIRA